VPGSMILIGGEPGIGKSTLLLQAAARLEAAGRTVLYASGYAPASLDRWAEKLRGWQAGGEDAYVYFDNDAFGAAPLNALQLIRLVNEKSVKPQVNADNFAGSEIGRPQAARRAKCRMHFVNLDGNYY